MQSATLVEPPTVLIRPGREFPATAAAVELTGVWAGYGGNTVLRNVSLRVEPGERHAIVGPSGSGKTTLLRLLKGLMLPSAGEVRTQLASGEHARIGYVPQNLGLVGSASVLQNALMGALHRVGTLRSWFGSFPAEEKDAAWEALEAVGISHLALRKAHQLSGGERRRLALARTLVQRPSILLADEFLSELDEGTSEQVLAALDAAQRRLGMTVILVEHNLRVACGFCDRVAVLCDGCVVAELEGDDLSEETLRCLVCRRIES
jgi:phosphonate transport system ATP-binding protein